MSKYWQNDTPPCVFTDLRYRLGYWTNKGFYDVRGCEIDAQRYREQIHHLAFTNLEKVHAWSRDLVLFDKVLCLRPNRNLEIFLPNVKEVVWPPKGWAIHFVFKKGGIRSIQPTDIFAKLDMTLSLIVQPEFRTWLSIFRKTQGQLS